MAGFWHCDNSPLRPPLRTCAHDIAGVSPTDLRMIDVGKRRSVYGLLVKGAPLDDPTPLRPMVDCSPAAGGVAPDEVDCFQRIYQRLGIAPIDLGAGTDRVAVRFDHDDRRVLAALTCTGDESMTCCSLPNDGDVVVATGVVDWISPYEKSGRAWTLRLEELCTLTPPLSGPGAARQPPLPIEEAPLVDPETWMPRPAADEFCRTDGRDDRSSSMLPAPAESKAQTDTVARGVTIAGAGDVKAGGVPSAAATLTAGLHLVRDCYVQTLLGDPHAGGELSYHLQILPDGSVNRGGPPAATGGPGVSDRLASCAGTALRRLRFAPPQPSGDATVHGTLVLAYDPSR